MADAPKNSNGKVVQWVMIVLSSLVIAGILGGIKLNSEVAVQSEKSKTLETRLDKMDAKLDKILSVVYNHRERGRDDR